MYKFRPIPFILISLSLFLSGCGITLFPGFQKGEPPAGDHPVLLFHDGDQSMLFNTRIDLFKNHFSGLSVVKPFTDTSYRVVFITETGLKIFDMEITEDSYRVHFIPDWLNKKALIKTMANDFGLLLRNDFSHAVPLKKEDQIILKTKNQGMKNLYFLEDDRVNRIIQQKRISKKVRADIFRSGETVDSVKISHYNINLTIQMRTIRKK